MLDRLLRLSIVSFLLVTSMASYALDSTDVLPKGVNSPSLRFGYVDGLDTQYSSTGKLESLHDRMSIEFDTKQLIKVKQDSARLIQTLNSFGLGQYGNDLHLGILHIDSKPKLQYAAAVHGWGISDKWTMGVGFPVLHYQNEISISHEGSNADQFRREFYGIHRDLDDGLVKVENASRNVITEFNSSMTEKGYKPLASKNETLFGDVQVASMYQLYRNRSIALTYKAQLTLPTGKPADPDDLASLDLFGRTSLENTLLSSFKIARNWSFNAKSGLTYFFQDSVTKRVPLNSSEQLVGPEGRENVTRQLGSSYLLGSSINWDMTSRWGVGVGYEYKQKQADSYSGSRNRAYSILAENSDSNSQLSRFGVTYSTVKAYLAKVVQIPFLVNFEISDTFSGKNVQRQLTSELSMVMFY